MRNTLVTGYYRLIEKLIRPMIRPDVSPNAISFFSVVVSFAAGMLYAFGVFFWGGLVLLLSGFLDTLDGTVARLRGQSTRFGALLDSTLDRYSDFFPLAGLLLFYKDHWVFFFILLSIIGSLMVSYIKARAESLGATRVVGLMQRPERLILLLAGSILSVPPSWGIGNIADIPLIASLCILGILTNLTAFHRLLAAKEEL